MTKISLSVILALVFSAFPVMAEDWTTTDGVVHKDVKIVEVGADSVTITDANGGGTIPFSALSSDLQKRFHYTPPASVDPMKVVASWTSITTSFSKVIPITKVTAVDAHSVHYETVDGAGSVEIADLPDDIQKSLGYDPAAAAKAVADQQARIAASDAMVAQVTAQEDAEKAQKAKIQAATDALTTSKQKIINARKASIEAQIAAAEATLEKLENEPVHSYGGNSTQGNHDSNVKIIEDRISQLQAQLQQQ